MAQNPLLTSLAAFGGKKETTAGTAETIAAAQCISAIKPALSPDNPMVELDVIQSRHGRVKPSKGGTTMKVSFGYPLKGTGTEGAGPPQTIQDALEAAGLTPTAHSGIMQIWKQLASVSSAPAFTAQAQKGGAAAATGKTRVALGCRFNMKLSLPAGKPGAFQFDGQGILSSNADATVLEADGEPTTRAPNIASADWFLAEYHAVLEEVAGGAILELRQLTGTVNEMVAKTITQGATAQKVYAVAVKLKKAGTPAGETNGVWVEIQGDSAGDPDGTAITNGTSAAIATAKIGTTAEWYVFLFATPPTLTGATVYHVVLCGDYTQHDSNNIEISTDVVTAPNQNSQSYSAASWAAVALKNLSMRIYACTGESDLIFAGGAELDLGNEIELQDDPTKAEGFRQALLTDQAPVISITPEEHLTTNKDFQGLLDDATSLFFFARIGTVAGNRWDVMGSKLTVIEGVDWGEAGKRMTRPLKLRVNADLDYGGVELRSR